MVRVKVSKSQVNSATRKLNREINQSIKREMQRLPVQVEGIKLKVQEIQEQQRYFVLNQKQFRTVQE